MARESIFGGSCHLQRKSHNIVSIGGVKVASWAKEKAGSLGLPCFDASSIEKLSGDNTHEEKERVLAALATG